MYLRDELFQRSREGCVCVYFPSCEATREMKSDINSLDFDFIHDDIQAGRVRN